MATATASQKPGGDLMMSASSVLTEYEKSISEHQARLDDLKNTRARVDAVIREMEEESADLTRQISETLGALKAEQRWRDLIVSAWQTQVHGAAQAAGSGEGNG